MKDNVERKHSFKKFNNSIIFYNKMMYHLTYIEINMYKVDNLILFENITFF